jgi:hypothetical protein
MNGARRAIRQWTALSVCELITATRHTMTDGNGQRRRGHKTHLWWISIVVIVPAVLTVGAVFFHPERKEAGETAGGIQSIRHLPDPRIGKRARVQPPNSFHGSPTASNTSPRREQEIKVDRARARMLDLIVRHKIVDFSPISPDDEMGRLQRNLDMLLNVEGEELVRVANELGLFPRSQPKSPEFLVEVAQAIRTAMINELTRRGGQIVTEEVPAARNDRPAELAESTKMKEYTDAKEDYRLELERLQSLFTPQSAK